MLPAASKALSELLIRDAKQHLFGLIETAAEPVFFRAHDAIRRDIAALADIRLAAGGGHIFARAGTIAVVVPVEADHVGTAVGAVTGTKRANVMPLGAERDIWVGN